MEWMHQESIDAPQREVFEALTRPEARARWVPNVGRVDGPEVLEAGVRFREDRRFLGRACPVRLEVTAWEPPNCVSLFADGAQWPGGRGRFEVQYVLEALDEGRTRLLVRANLTELGNVGSGVARVLEPWLSRSLEKEHEALRRHFGSGARS